MSARIVEQTFRIEGMTCSGCELKIERILKRLNGVKNVSASFSSNSVIVSYDGNTVGEKEFSVVLEKAGYALLSKSAKGSKRKTAQSDTFSLKQFIGIAVVLVALYLIIKNTIGFNFIPEVTESMGYGMLLIVGLLTSLHCVAMCGGINMAQCVTYTNKPGDVKAKLKPSLLYNLGRMVSYTIIGGVVGALGSVVSFTGWARGLVAILSGLFMVIMGLSMLGIFPWLNKITPRMPRFLQKKAGEARKGKGPFIVGLLNGLMPCGPLQSMQLYALGTGSFIAGASSMLVFSLGTVPLMFGLGALSSMLSGKFTAKMMKVSAVLVLVLGLIMANRGLALSGVSVLPSLSPQPTATGNVQAPQNNGDVQIITTELTENGYPEITVKKGIPVRWNLKADEEDLNGCNNAIIIPQYNIEMDLKPGDNIIEFTPTEEGTIPYSCWMGMITSQINVVSD